MYVLNKAEVFLVPQGSSGSQVPQNKYAELLAIIEEIGKEIRPTYAGSKSAMERLKRGKAFKSSSARRAILLVTRLIETLLSPKE